jgi:hypothetical protein
MKLFSKKKLSRPLTFAEMDDEFYSIACKTVEDNLAKGKRAHRRQIEWREGMKLDVNMFRHAEFEKSLYLYSEPFDTYEEALHFSECFNDNFLYNSYVELENGKYVVYSGWLKKENFIVYCLPNKNVYWTFPNCSTWF